MSAQTEMTPDAACVYLTMMCEVFSRPDVPPSLREPLQEKIVEMLDNTFIPLEKLAKMLSTGPRRLVVLQKPGSCRRVRLCHVGLDSAGWPAWLPGEAWESPLDLPVINDCSSGSEAVGRLTGEQAHSVAKALERDAQDAGK